MFSNFFFQRTSTNFRKQLPENFTFPAQFTGHVQQNSDVGSIDLSSCSLKINPVNDLQNVIVNGEVVKGKSVKVPFSGKDSVMEVTSNHQLISNGKGTNIYLSKDTLIVNYKPCPWTK